MKSKPAVYTRWIILCLVLGGTMLINFLHIYGSAIYPSVHAICPLGGLENLWAWVAGKSNLQKLFSGTMILFFFTLAFTLIFGRAFCGNICPFGGLQELLGKISKRKFAFPQKIDRILRLTKYLLLILVTIMAWITASIWISPYDPYAAFSHIWEGSELFVEMGIGFAILIIVLGASIFIDRFFCKYLCPAGALYGFISKISPTKIKRNTECSSCGLCSRACPMNINVDNVAAVKSAECIACGQCVSACLSKNNAIQMTIFGKAVKPLVFVIATVVIFFTSIAAFDRAGLFQVTIPSLTSVTESGNHLNIADLRGSMSIETGAEYTGMELSEFYKTMEIPQTVPKETLFKDVPSYVPGYDFHVIKVK